MSKFSVKKPLTVLVAVVIVLVLGFVSLTKMTPDLMPNMDMPYVMVTTAYPGATPEEVETQLTKPMEQAMGTLDNIDEITSTSNANYSTVVMKFTTDVNMDTISVDILQKINAISGEWDDSVGTPHILKMNPSMMPVAVAAVNMEGKDGAELSSFLNSTLMNQLEGIPGVASITANGAVEQTMHVAINQKKIDKLNKKIQKAIDEQFSDGEEQLSQAQSDLETARANLQAQQAALEEQKNQLAQQTSQSGGEMNQKEAEITEGKIQLQTQLVALQTQLTELEEKEAKLQETQKTITKLETSEKQLKKSISQLKNAQSTVKKLEQAEAGYKQKIQEINQNSALSDKEKEAAKKQIYNSDGYRQTVAGLSKLDAQLTAMGTDRNNISTAQSEANDALEEVQNGLKTIDTTLAGQGLKRSDVSSALSEISSGKAKISASQQKLTETAEQLENGQIQLSQAMEVLEQQKTSAIFQLSDATTRLILGESNLDASAKEVSAQMETLQEKKEAAYTNTDLNEILTMDTVSKILSAQNFSMPAGYVQQDGVDTLVTVGDKITSQDDLSNTTLLDLGLEGIHPIRVSDVADVTLQDNGDEVYANINGNDGILLTFSKQSTDATADVSNNIKAKFDELSKKYEGLTFTSLMDQGDYIYSIINSIFQSLILGAVFAVLILFLFLRDIKPTFIILCSIPISVLFAFVLMYFSGVTLNMISMSGLAVAVGMLVDNSVVVIENIYRLRNKGVSAVKSAVIGASQVAAAIASSTLTTICVFLPIVFVQGITRQLFTDMALTMGYALIASLIVALSLVPAMSSRMLKRVKPRSHKLFDHFLNGYEKSLRFSLRFKPLVLILAVVLLAGSGALAFTKGFTFMPETSASQVALEMELPEGSVLDDTRATANEAVTRIQQIEGVETVGAMLSSSNGMMSGMGSGSNDVRHVLFYITVDDKVKKTSKALTEEIIAACDGLSGTFQESAMSGASGMMGGLNDNTIKIRVYGDDLDTLQNASNLVAGKLTEVEGTANVSNGIEDPDPAIKIVVNKKKAMAYNLTVAQVYQQISTAMQTDSEATSITEDGDTYKVILEKANTKKLTPDMIRNYVLDITKEDGTEESIPLSEIAQVTDTETLSAIQRIDQQRYLDVSAELGDGYNISLVTENAKQHLQELELPEGCRIEFDGGNEDIMASMKDLVMMLALGVLLVYLIMVAQFQSLKHPFIIMFTIPLAFTGGLLGLLICGMEVSVISMIGFVMLCGIIVNNGIVLVDYINQLRRAGMQKREAIVEAGKTRMRPILMTTITTVLGLLFMALGIGGGNEMMQPVAVVCIGGLLYATLLTLYVIPVIYDLMNRKDLKRLKLEDLDIVSEEELDRELALLETSQGKHLDAPLPREEKASSEKEKARRKAEKLGQKAEKKAEKTAQKENKAQAKANKRAEKEAKKEAKQGRHGRS
ncbi:MAG: efflux RND transporter permease subunit [Oscillospiraceae bacterium]|nr:efflux RND transporter permease subunit [Oscillospiraceae bacterium]